jgi:dihydroxyacid dehydratase/phosphogluconate dehydratase
MAAATVNIPAIALSVGPMLNGWHKGERTGSGTIVWKGRQMLAAGESTRMASSSWSLRPRRRPAIATRWARPPR